MKLRLLAVGHACAVPGLILAQSVTFYGAIGYRPRESSRYPPVELC